MVNKKPVMHDSDCSTNNRGVPELLGPCDCSVAKLKRGAHFHNALRDTESFRKSK